MRSIGPTMVFGYERASSPRHGSPRSCAALAELGDDFVVADRSADYDRPILPLGG